MKTRRGFTVIELLIVTVVVAVGAYAFYNEKIVTDAVRRDSARKVAVNAMYYNLEEVYYEKNNFYPSTIDSKTLRAMDPGLFYDPNGVKLGESNASYRYEGLGCTPAGQCKGYKLSSTMEREADFVKTNRNK